MFEDLDNDEYERRQDKLKDDDFIVDDEGYGYKDNGGEIWDNDESYGKDRPSKKRAKLQDKE